MFERAFKSPKQEPVEKDIEFQSDVNIDPTFLSLENFTGKTIGDMIIFFKDKNGDKAEQSSFTDSTYQEYILNNPEKVSKKMQAHDDYKYFFFEKAQPGESRNGFKISYLRWNPKNQTFSRFKHVFEESEWDRKRYSVVTPPHHF